MSNSLAQKLEMNFTGRRLPEKISAPKAFAFGRQMWFIPGAKFYAYEN
jgi:hypothetical protein